jgi:outer membrane protein assembly factor BamB
MKIIITGLLIIFAGYQSSINEKRVIAEKAISANMVDTLMLNVEYPIHVEYTSAVDSDTMFFYMGNDKLLITPKGNVTKNNKPFLEIHPAGNIKKVFPFIIGTDIVTIYSFSTLDGESGSFAKRISLKQNNVIWETSINGFNLARPVLIGNYVYLSTIGFVGKLNITNGKFIWEFDDFFKNGNFISFNEPVFYKDSVVLFTEKSPSNATASSILIDDRNSRVLKIKR